MINCEFKVLIMNLIINYTLWKRCRSENLFMLLFWHDKLFICSTILFALLIFFSFMIASFSWCLFYLSITCSKHRFHFISNHVWWGLAVSTVPLGGTAGANLYPPLSLYVLYRVICELWFTGDLHDLPAAMIHGSTPTLEFSGRMLMSQSSWEGVSFSPGCETQAVHVWGLRIRLKNLLPTWSLFVFFNYSSISIQNSGH